MSFRSYALVALLCPIAFGSVQAQGPVITPDGDPSVRNDTIYALAVDSTKHPEEQAVYLLDDGVVRYEKDGTGTRTYRMVTQILKQQAVETWSEFTFRYDSEREDFVLNWARVLNTDGTAVSEKPIHVQEGDAPVPEQSPIYTKYKVVRVSLGNVAPGRIVDYSYTITTRKPVLAGNFLSNWVITNGRTTRRSRLVLDVPQGMHLNVSAMNLNFQPIVKRSRGREVTTWYRADIARFEPELFVPDSNDVMQTIVIGGPATWSDIARWYAGLARARYTVTPELLAKLAEVTAGAKTRFDSLIALHRWVSQDVRYVSISLGEGSFQPRLPAEVVGTMSGDCKDKATLFIAMARQLGYTAFPVLTNSTARPDRKIPSIDAFDHEIAAVQLDGKWHFVDLTADIVPFHEPPPATAGKFGLLVRDDGTFEALDMPDSPAERNISASLLSGSISAEGQFEGEFSRELHGFSQYSLRSDFAEALTEKETTETTAAIAAALIEGAMGDSLQITRGYDLSRDPSVRLRISAERVLKPAADGWLFNLPLPRYNSPQLVAQLEREAARIFPLDAEAVFGPRTVRSELKVSVPTGWKADLPPNVTARSGFGNYEAVYAQNGNTITVTRTVSGVRGVVDKSRKSELIEWLRGLGKDDVGFIILHAPN